MGKFAGFLKRAKNFALNTIPNAIVMSKMGGRSKMGGSFKNIKRWGLIMNFKKVHSRKKKTIEFMYTYWLFYETAFYL